MCALIYGFVPNTTVGSAAFRSPMQNLDSNQSCPSVSPVLCLVLDIRIRSLEAQFSEGTGLDLIPLLSAASAPQPTVLVQNDW
jgi:hypothetical protein